MRKEALAPFMRMQPKRMLPVADTKTVEITSVGRRGDEAGQHANTPLVEMRPKRMRPVADNKLAEISPARCGGQCSTGNDYETNICKKPW